ncbi:MAG: hypothetical protein Q7K43_02340 [Candidatus Woesearchaeota archaeon]|nr:hypothetical protein [Candidatus Woesearchaeota archaeon]
MYQIVFAALGGSVLRVLFGVYKVYAKGVLGSIDVKRILIEFVSALVFGVPVAFVLLDIGVLKVNGVLGVAFLAGLFGPDLMNVLARKVGVSNAFSFNVSSSGSSNFGLLPAQRKALDLASSGGITNDDYQKIAKVSDATASRQLNVLVKKGLVRKTGTGKGTRYVT